MNCLKFESRFFLLTVILTLGFAIQAIAQVNISGATAGNGSYSSLRLAFNAINATAQTNSNIVVTIAGNTVETATATLNPGTWSSLTIKPAGERIVSGNLTTSVINLNGADNVILDGLNTEGNSLTVTNTNSGTSWGTCTLYLTNGATYNTIRNCTFKGAAQNPSMGVVSIFASGNLSNHHNTVDSCTVMPAVAGTFPVCGIVVRGSTAFPDNYTAITNNDISDSFSIISHSSGIYTAYAQNLLITGNHIYQTEPRTGTSSTASVIHRGINIATSAYTGHTITGNTIGYSSNARTGKTIYSSPYQMSFFAMEISPGTTSTGLTTIADNEIAGIETNNNYSGTNFIAMYITGGADYDIQRNTVGSLTSNNSIVFSSTLNNRYIGGIYTSCSGSCIIADNNIGGISTAGTADITYHINCIQSSGTGSYTITGNTIGSTLANSIVSGTSGVTLNNVGTIYGIHCNATGASVTVSNNIVQNITAYSEKNPQMRPIRVSGGTNVTINNNLLADIAVTGTGSFIGIQNVAGGLNAEMNNNLIKNIYAEAGNYYGISNAGSVSGTLNIANNRFGDNSAPAALLNGAGTPNIFVIHTSSSVVHSALNITGNDFRSIQAPNDASNYQYFIYNGAQSYSQNISNNTFTNITLNNSKTVILMRNDVNLPAGSVQTISNNRNVGPMVKTGAGSLYLYYASYATAVANATSIQSNNNFSYISVPDSAVMYGWYANNNGNAIKQVEGNTFNNWTLGTATHYAIQMNGFSTGSYIRQNTISNITSQGQFSPIVLGSSSAATDLHVDNNTFTNISTASGALTIINSYSNSPGILIHDNQINTIASIAPTTIALTPILISGGTGVCSIYNNTISGITNSATGTSSINGIAVNGGTTVSVYSNQINTMSLTGTTTTGLVVGISIAGGSYVSAYNNIIGALTAPYCSNTLSVIGIRATGASTATTCNVYNNTVYLNASSTGTNFGSAALYHRASATADIAKLILKNNVLINRSSYSGAGLTAAIWRTGTPLANYDASSNNNLLYAGTPSPKNLILYNSSGASANDQTIAGMKLRVSPAESNSVTENTAFASVDAANPLFLHIADGTVTLAESNGAAVAGLITDIDGESRNEDFPDIGADEFTGALPTLTGINADEFCSSTAGQPVTATGTNLGLIKSVTFAGPSGRLTATITAQSAGSVTFNTPSGFVSGEIRLNYGGSYLEHEYFAYGIQSGGTLSGSTSVCPANASAVLTLGTHHGTVVKWQQSPTADFSSGVTDIAVTGDSLSVSSLSQTTYYRVVVNTPCGITYSTTATLSIASTTWNGTSWTNGLPDSSKAVIIAANLLLPADTQACTLTVTNGAAVTVAALADLTVAGSITVNSGSSLTIMPTANLLQLTDAANTGNINVQQNSAALFRLDYTLWSSPVSGVQTLQQFSPATSSTRFYSYNTFANTYTSINAASSVFSIGRSYLIRMPNNWVPYNASAPQPAAWTGTFTGTPNNGTITVTGLGNGGTTATRFNAVGNPYPSAIDIADFISANSSSIEGTLWLWRKTNDQNNPVSYSTCTAVGCTRNNGFTGYQDDTVLEKGQGFIVKLKEGVTSLRFTNAMRRGDNNAQLFRQAQKNRYWLDIKNSSAGFTQLLIAHMPGGSAEYNDGLDGLYFNDSPTFMGTLANGKQLSIDARSEFNVMDVVPLYFATTAGGEYSISLNNAEGIFNNGQYIYLKDKNTGAIHNLTLSAYTFSTAAGNFNNRFEIVYQMPTVKASAIKAPVNDSFTAFNEDGRLSLSLNHDAISEITVYDLVGKEILYKNNIGSSTFISDRLNVQHQVLLVKVISSSGIVYVKKIAF